SGGAVKALKSDGTTITLGTVGGAITDAYTSIGADSGTASASGGAQLSIVGANGISTTAADGSPDSLTITLGSHSADLLTSGEVDPALVPETAITQHEGALAITWSQVNKTGSSLADLATRSAGALDSGNLAYGCLPTGSGSWDVGSGNTLTFTRAAAFSSTIAVTSAATFSAAIVAEGGIRQSAN